MIRTSEICPCLLSMRANYRAGASIHDVNNASALPTCARSTFSTSIYIVLLLFTLAISYYWRAISGPLCTFLAIIANISHFALVSIDIFDVKMGCVFSKCARDSEEYPDANEVNVNTSDASLTRNVSELGSVLYTGKSKTSHYSYL